MLCQLSTDGGATFNTSNYYWGSIYVSNTGVTGALNGGPTSSWTLFTALSNTLDGISGDVRLFHPLGTFPRRSAIFDVIAAQAGFVYRNEGFGTWVDSTAVNAVRFKFAAGNIASGIIRSYGFEA
jgi:hypothetical protein